MDAIVKPWPKHPSAQNHPSAQTLSDHVRALPDPRPNRPCREQAEEEVRTLAPVHLDDPDAGWQLGAAPPLTTGRAHFNTVLLPDGSIFTNLFLPIALAVKR